jgi:hypothetical protein
LANDRRDSRADDHLFGADVSPQVDNAPLLVAKGTQLASTARAGIYMHKITLVCSLHRENGLCNAGELLRLLRSIDPDVIFGEVPQSDIDFYNPRSLEGQAVANFRAFKSFQRVPVDRYDMPPSFRAATESVFDFVEQASQDYLRLQDERDNAAHLNGFAYLNSAAFAQVITRMSEIEVETINSSGNQYLGRGLATWRQVMRRREKVMVDNIYRYCQENVFDKGVFRVGAAHRSGILKAVEEFSSTDTDLIEWKLYF